MAARRRNLDSDEQLDLFTSPKATYDTIDTIRPDGRETLARTPSEDGARTGTEGSPSSNAAGRRGKDQGGAGDTQNAVDETGINGATSSRPGLGDGTSKVHPASTRRIKRQRDELPRNLNNYRIAEAERLGEGGPKQKFQRNLKAIRQ